jgi:CRP-like cAMP-binding protein
MAKRSPLDRAREARMAGKTDEALRLAIGLLQSDVQQLGAALFLARVLIHEGRGFLAAEVATRLVDAFTRRGDLPQAVVAAKAAAEAGEDEGALLKRVAEAFGSDSDRLANVAPAPPPLPPNVEPPKALAAVKGDALMDKAEAALQGYFESDDDVAEDSKLPELPLFSGLDADELKELLAAFSLKDVKGGDTLVVEGEEGTEAFVIANGVLHVERRAEEGEQPLLLAALGPGAIFGEMALVSDAPRAASVVADEVATVLAIGREDLERLATVTPEIGQQLATFCRGRMIANLLRHSSILGSVSGEDRESLFHRFHTEHFDPGQPLVEEGQEGQGLYLLASGAVEVVGKDSDGDELRITELGPGNVVGEISLVLRRPANATVRALTPTVALHLERDAFQDAIREHPTLLGELYETATQRDEETRTVVAQEAMDVEDIVLL